VALLNAFRKAMAELDVAGRLIATDMTTASSAFHAADVGVISPPVGRLEYVASLVDIVRNHKVGLLVPLTDLDLRSLARQRGRFAAMGCTVMIGEEDDVKICRDKAKTNDLCAKAGLGSIRTLPLQEFYDQPFYPCFVKPVRGSASVGTSLIRNEGELHAHVATYGDLLLAQEFVPGQEFTIDVYRDRQGQVRCIVPRLRLAVRAGEVAKAVTVRDDELIAATHKLADMLGSIWGVFCCQCRRAHGGAPRFFEVNPRFGGGAPLSIAAGVNLPLYLLQEVLGLPITAELGKFQEDLLMLRYDEAVFVPVDNAAKLPGYESPIFR
jgi:carbamoyl-phosphate synthase large subunit